MVCHTKIDPRIVQLQWLCVCLGLINHDRIIKVTGILPYFTDHQSDLMRFSWTQPDALRSMKNYQRRKLLLLLQSSKSLKDNASSIGKPQYPQNMHQDYLCDLRAPLPADTASVYKKLDAGHDMDSLHTIKEFLTFIYT